MGLEMRGYFGVGIYRPKTEANVGTLWRTAYLMDAAFVFTVGERYHKQAADTPDTARHVPLLHFGDFDDLIDHLPEGCHRVAVEQGGRTLVGWSHPERCVYLLGAEDDGLPIEVLRRCGWTITIPSVREQSMNVAVAGSIVLYDRLAKTRGPHLPTPA